LHKADLPPGRRVDFLRVIARVKPDYSIEQARVEMTTIGQRLAQQYPNVNAAWTLETVPVAEAISGDVRTPLLLLLGSAALLLLIACANVANLSLARSTERRREFAIRSALGGGSARLFRQLITESLVLSLLGGIAGLLLGIFTMRSMLVIGSAFIPRAADVRLDPWVLLFAFVAACLTGVLFGALPARQAARTDLNESLKAAGRGSVGPGRGRARALLVVSEVGLTLVLLVAAGLLLRSFWRVQAVPLGFEPTRVLTADVRLPGGGPNNPAPTIRFLSEFVSRLERLPGVNAVAAINAAPMSGRGNELSFNIEGRPAPSGNEVQDAFVNMATPGYFGVMGIRLLRGRLLTSADTAEAPGAAVISEGMVRQYFPTEDPLGHRFTLDGKYYYTIVGVVADVHHEGFTTTPKAHIYVPHPQFPLLRMTIVVRASLDPLTLVSAVRGELRAMDKNLPLINVKTEEALLAESVAPRRFALTLIGTFAGLALLLASIGIYGVISYSVTECTQEFGVRMAMGAMRRDVLGMVLWRGLRLAGAGIAAGALAAFAVSRVLGSFLFGVTSHDPVTFSTVAGVFITVSLAACLIPALRATRVDPMVALRYE
jgi:putative ABC transport system permease protein